MATNQQESADLLYAMRAVMVLLGSGIGLEEGEMILLSPLSEADQLNLGESVQNKGDIKGVEPLEDDGKTVDPLAKGTKLPSDEPSLTDDQKAKLETAKTKMKGKNSPAQSQRASP